MTTDKIIESLALSEQAMTPAQFRAYRSKWLVELQARLDNDDPSVDVIALIENIRDSFLGEL